MINKKLMIFAIFLVSILAVSAVSAADNATEDIASADKTTDDVVSIEENQVILKENNDVGTFDDLQRAINNAPEGSVLNLTRDYNGAEDAVVWLNKDLTLDGQGHTIDCNGDDCSAFYSDAGTITLKNLKIINGYNDDNYKGGAIYIGDASQYTIINCTFENNWADDYGGAIYNGANPLTIINSSFDNNKVDDDDGGAIYSKGDLDIKNSKFTSNHACDNGGAIYCEKSVSVENCIFESNSAEIDGGAIYAKGDVRVKNTTFRKNQADTAISQCHGGAINSEGNVEVEHSTFIANHAYDYGGAIYANTAALSSSSFKENSASDNDGGAIYIKEDLTVDDCRFNNNNANEKGGAICVSGDAHIKNSHFESNAAVLSGGAISSFTVNVDKCLFKSNKATEHKRNVGGAISVGAGKITNSIFEYNRAIQGGAILSYEYLTLDNSTFRYNHADEDGGAIYAASIHLADSPSYFISNYAYDEGGAIYTNTFNTDVRYGVFIQNTAERGDGGAIYINEATNRAFSQCYFENNHCGDEGGAIYSDSVNSHLTLKSNVFVDNWAENKGKIVYNCGYYDFIGYNWYGANKFDFSNKFVEYKRWTSDVDHTDEHMIQARMYMDENITIGKEANLTVYFSNENTPADLFMIDPSFKADNHAVLSDWHTFNGSAYVKGITVTRAKVTHITAQIHHQTLKLEVSFPEKYLTLNVSAEPITEGENATVIVTGLENATGNAYVFDNLTLWAGKIENGIAKIIVPGLKENTTVIVSFPGDGIYAPAGTSINITVYPRPKENLTIEAITKPMTVGANATVIVTGLENATGNVTVTVNNKTYAAPIENGNSTVLIQGITENVTAIVKYAGDERYNPASTTVNITVNPAVDTKLQSKIYLRNALYFVTQTKMVRVTLWDANNRPMANKTVHLRVCDLEYTGLTDENGDAYIRVGVGFGVHNATVSFDGDDQYNASNRTGQIRVIKETPSIMVRGDNQQFRANDNPKIVKVYLWDRNSKPLPVNSKVAIKLNGITYIGYTDSQGIASIKINVNKPGTFNAELRYAGNSAYNAISRPVKLVIS